MAIAEPRLSSDAAPAASVAAGRGFRPTSRRRARMAAGAALAAVGVGGNVLLYTSLDDQIEVVQVVDNVRAGDQITPEDLRIVEVDVDATVPVVTADRIGTLIGQYATVYIAAGTLMVDVLVGPDPLVTPGRSVVAIELTPSQVPDGIVERSRVQLVTVEDNLPNFVVEARVVDLIGVAADGSEEGAMSFEVDAADAAALAAAAEVRVVLLDPGADPALPPAGDAPSAPSVSAPATQTDTSDLPRATLAPVPTDSAPSTAPPSTSAVAP
jgi:hypothetical protein